MRTAALVALTAVLAAAGLVLFPPAGRPALVWAIAGAAALAIGLVRRFPVAALAIEVVLVLATDFLVPGSTHVAPLAAGVALGVVSHRHGWPVTLGGFAVAYAAILLSVGRDEGDLLTGLNGIVRIVVFGLALAAPVASGRYLAEIRRAGVVAEERRREEALAARLAERARLAGDLHDLVAHHVSAIALRAGSGHYAATNAADPGQRLTEAVDALGSIQHSARQALVDLRGLLRVLSDPAGRAALVDPEAMIDEAVRRSREAGLEVAARVGADTAGAPLTVRVTAARVVQEALTNVLKHAGPGTVVDAVVDFGDQHLRVEVANSRPPGRPPGLPGSGHGLAGMRERVEILGGTLDAGPTGAGGWRLCVALPTAVPR